MNNLFYNDFSKIETHSLYEIPKNKKSSITYIASGNYGCCFLIESEEEKKVVKFTLHKNDNKDENYRLAINEILIADSISDLNKTNNHDVFLNVFKIGLLKQNAFIETKDIFLESLINNTTINISKFLKNKELRDSGESYNSEPELSPDLDFDGYISDEDSSNEKITTNKKMFNPAEQKFISFLNGENEDQIIVFLEMEYFNKGTFRDCLITELNGASNTNTISQHLAMSYYLKAFGNLCLQMLKLRKELTFSHNDIRLANILVKTTENIIQDKFKICDFGQSSTKLVDLNNLDIKLYPNFLIAPFEWIFDISNFKNKKTTTIIGNFFENKDTDIFSLGLLFLQINFMHTNITGNFKLSLACNINEFFIYDLLNEDLIKRSLSDFLNEIPIEFNGFASYFKDGRYHLLCNYLFLMCVQESIGNGFIPFDVKNDFATFLINSKEKIRNVFINNNKRNVVDLLIESIQLNHGYEANTLLKSFLAWNSDIYNENTILILEQIENIKIMIRRQIS